MREADGVPLAELTTMRVGGPAQRLFVAESIDELVDVVREVDDADEPLLVLSGGSNLVIADEGFAGTVVRVGTAGIDAQPVGDRVRVRVAAGEEWDDVVATACREHWSGIEALSGIPGLTGATPVQNVGAYGQEVAQTIETVRVWDRREQRVAEFTNADCEFAYRHSIFKASAYRGGGRYVVLDTTFSLEAAPLAQPVGYDALARGLDVPIGARVPLGDARAAVLEQRRRRGMVLDPADHDTWSCGSFFTNPIISTRAYDELARLAGRRAAADAPPPPRWPAGDGVKTSAAWLIQHAGFDKGYGLPGPAALSSKHPLAVTNRGAARAADIAELAREVRDGVLERFGVRLVNEPVFVGHEL